MIREAASGRRKGGPEGSALDLLRPEDDLGARVYAVTRLSFVTRP